jgi:hypothetical protein
VHEIQRSISALCLPGAAIRRKQCDLTRIELA